MLPIVVFMIEVAVFPSQGRIVNLLTYSKGSEFRLGWSNNIRYNFFDQFFAFQCLSHLEAFSGRDYSNRNRAEAQAAFIFSDQSVLGFSLAIFRVILCNPKNVPPRSLTPSTLA